MNDYVVAIAEDPYVYREDSGINIQEDLNLKKGTRFELIKEILDGHEPRGMVCIEGKYYTVTLNPKYGWVLRKQKLIYTDYEYSNTETHKYSQAVNDFGVTQQMIDDHWTKYRIDGGMLSSRIFNHNDHRDRKLASFLSEIIDQFVDEDLGYSHSDLYNRYWLDFYFALSLYRPRRSERFPGKITVYKDHQSYVDDKQTALRPGRAFSILFPYLDAAQIGIIVDSYRTRFSPRQFELHTSTQLEDFVWAYKHDHCKYEDPSTSMERKSLATSCMRGDGFNHLDHHPAEFYASGDFMIVWLTTPDGLIGGRCVVRLPYIKYSTYKYDGVLQYPFDYEVTAHIAAPVYGTCDTSINMIEEYLDSIGADRSCHGGGWIGAKLLALVNSNDRYYGAYIDLEPRMLSRVGDYLIIDSNGDLSAEDTGGMVGNYHEYYCSSCDEGLDEYDQYYSDELGETFCESCYHDRHTHCECCDESYLNDNIHDASRMVTWTDTNDKGNRIVRTSRRDVTVCEHCLTEDYRYCEEEDEHWDNEDVAYIEDEDIYVPIHLLEEKGFKEQEDGEYKREGE